MTLSSCHSWLSLVFTQSRAIRSTQSVDEEALFLRLAFTQQFCDFGVASFLGVP